MLRLYRPNHHRDIYRRYKIWIDNQLLDTIKIGETKEIQLEPGKHSIQLQIDWCYSPVVICEVFEDEDLEFLVWKFFGVLETFVGVFLHFHIPSKISLDKKKRTLIK